MKNNLKYKHILKAVANEVWGIEPQKLQQIMAFLELKANGGTVSEDDIEAVTQAKSRPSKNASGTVAVLPLRGTIVHRSDAIGESSGMMGIERFMSSFRASVADPAVKSIVIDVDSPGGTVPGVPEAATEIFNAREKKHIVAIANSMSASAAYWLATAADELVVTPSGSVGSVGVFTVHEDYSEYMEDRGIKTTYISAGDYKVEANPFEPLSSEAQEYLQQSVQETYTEFVNALAKHRGISAKDVKENYGKGRMLSAKAALKAGMVDRIDTLDGVLSRLGVSSAASGVRSNAISKQQAVARLDILSK
ncbi:MAG: S49 family peptidase [Pseudomonadales bacterium]|nr:S49 family peptidase [Pseudomonadales bacterium]